MAIYRAKDPMSDCYSDKGCAIEALMARQRATLKIVLAINAVMFLVELAAGLFARSTALLSDSLGPRRRYCLRVESLRRLTRGALQGESQPIQERPHPGGGAVRTGPGDLQHPASGRARLRDNGNRQRVGPG